MSYVKSNLMPGEQIVAVGRTHWCAFMPGALRLGFGLALGWAVLRLAASGRAEPLVFLGLAVATVLCLKGLYRLTVALVAAWTTELVITDKRVIVKWGLVRRGTIELQHSKVESLNVIQGILDRVLDCGTLVVHGIGGAEQAIHHIAAPLAFRRALYQN